MEPDPWCPQGALHVLNSYQTKGPSRNKYFCRPSPDCRVGVASKDLASSATASCLQQRTRTTAGERQNPPDHEEYLCKQALYSDEVALNNLFPGNGDQGPEAWAEEFYCCGLGSASGFLMKWRASNHLHICWDTTALHWQAKFLPCIGYNFFIQMVQLLASSNAA